MTLARLSEVVYCSVNFTVTVYINSRCKYVHICWKHFQQSWLSYCYLLLKPKCNWHRHSSVTTGIYFCLKVPRTPNQIIFWT